MVGEERARRIIENELGLTVALNDDNSKAGMYDLRIGASGTPEVAIECVGAVDSILTETWNIGPAEGPLNLPLAGDWTVVISRSARIKSIRKCIASLLQDLEVRRIRNLQVDHRLKRVDMLLFNELESLGIEWAYCYTLEGSGEVHFTMPGGGGVVDDTGSSVPGWLSDFLRALVAQMCLKGSTDLELRVAMCS